MPFDNGTFTGLANSFNNAISGQIIDPLDWNELFTDIEAGINGAASGVGSFGKTDVASASTCDIGAATTGVVRITGTTTITSLGSVANSRKWVYFAAALTLTHNATTLILPGGGNITTAAGDTMVVVSDSSGNWRCWEYRPANGGVFGSATSAPASGASGWDDGAGAQLIVRTTAAHAANVGGAITFRALDNTGTLRGYAAIKGGIDQVNTNRGFLSFLLRDNVSYATEWMRAEITSDANSLVTILGASTFKSNVNWETTTGRYLKHTIGDTTSWYNGTAGVAWELRGNDGGSNDRQLMYLSTNLDFNETTASLLPNGGVPWGTDTQWQFVSDATYWNSTNKLRQLKLLDGTTFSAAATLNGSGNITSIAVTPSTLTGYAPNTTYYWAVNGGGGPNPSTGPRVGSFQVVADSSGHITASSFKAANGSALSVGNPVVGPWSSAPYIGVDMPPLTTAGIKASDSVSGTGIPGATTVLSIDSTSQITLSANATATNTRVLLTVGSDSLKYYGNTTNGSAVVTAVHGRFLADVGSEFFVNRDTSPYGMSAGSIIGSQIIRYTPEDGTSSREMGIYWKVEDGSVSDSKAYMEFIAPSGSSAAGVVNIGAGVWDPAYTSSSPGFGTLAFTHLKAQDVTIDANNALIWAGSSSSIAHSGGNLLTYTAATGHAFSGGAVIPAANNSQASGIAGNAWSSVSSYAFAAPGSSSGTATIVAQAAAGTPSLTLPNTSGTFAVSASGPLSLNTTTGALSIAGSALTRTDDTNVTLTLGGSPTSALLAAASLTLGWSGTLAVARGGTGTGTAGIGAFNNITGLSSSGFTGTTSTNLVFSTSPVLTTVDARGVWTAGATWTLPAHTLGGTVTGGGNTISNITLSSAVLGTPTSGTLTNCTGLPISTGVSGLGTGVATFLATPSSANLLAAVTDETGTGALVFGTSPTFTTQITTPKIIGGSGTTGVQATWQTTTGNGTTDAFSLVGGNNGATQFAWISNAGMGLGTNNPTSPNGFNKTLDLSNTGAAAGYSLTLRSSTGAAEFGMSSDLYFVSPTHFYLQAGSGKNVVFYTSGSERGHASDVGIHSELSFILKDGITAPSTIAGYASIYVDTADGDLKVKFGDGTIKTIVVDT